MCIFVCACVCVCLCVYKGTYMYFIHHFIGERIRIKRGEGEGIQERHEEERGEEGNERERGGGDRKETTP